MCFLFFFQLKIVFYKALEVLCTLHMHVNVYLMLSSSSESKADMVTTAPASIHVSMTFLTFLIINTS